MKNLFPVLFLPLASDATMRKHKAVASNVYNSSAQGPAGSIVWRAETTFSSPPFTVPREDRSLFYDFFRDESHCHILMNDDGISEVVADPDPDLLEKFREEA